MPLRRTAAPPHAPNLLKDVLRGPDLHGAGGLRAVPAAEGGREATLAPAPPPRHPAGCAARTRRRARRGGRPDALPRPIPARVLRQPCARRNEAPPLSAGRTAPAQFRGRR